MLGALQLSVGCIEVLYVLIPTILLLFAKAALVLHRQSRAPKQSTPQLLSAQSNNTKTMEQLKRMPRTQLEATLAEIHRELDNSPAGTPPGSTNQPSLKIQSSIK